MRQSNVSFSEGVYEKCHFVGKLRIVLKLLLYLSLLVFIYLFHLTFIAEEKQNISYNINVHI